MYRFYNKKNVVYEALVALFSMVGQNKIQQWKG